MTAWRIPTQSQTKREATLANARRRNTTPSGGTGASILVSRGPARSRCRRLGWGGHPRSRRFRVESPQSQRSLARRAREGASFRDVRRAGTEEVSSPSPHPQSSRGTSRAVEPRAPPRDQHTLSSGPRTGRTTHEAGRIPSPVGSNAPACRQWRKTSCSPGLDSTREPISLGRFDRLPLPPCLVWSAPQTHPRSRPKAQRGMRLWGGSGRSVKADSVPDDLSPRSRLLFLRRIRRVVGGLEPLVGRGRRSAVRLGEELREEGGQEGPGTGSIRTGHHERIRRHSDLAVSDLLHYLPERDPVAAEHVGLGVVRVRLRLSDHSNRRRVSVRLDARRVADALRFLDRGLREVLIDLDLVGGLDDAGLEVRPRSHLLDRDAPLLGRRLLLILRLLLDCDLLVRLGREQGRIDRNVGDEQVLGCDVVLGKLHPGPVQGLLLQLGSALNEFERLLLPRVVPERRVD